MDKDSNWESAIIQFPNWKALYSRPDSTGHLQDHAEKGVAKVNELMGLISLSSGIQTWASGKSIIDNLEGMVIWEYDSLTCPK